VLRRREIINRHAATGRGPEFRNGRNLAAKLGKCQMGMKG
jgi:hypothetical protein